jgi:hypothetical protein
MHVDITFQFPRGSRTITFDLLDNPGVKAWAEHCLTITPARQLKYQKPVIDNIPVSIDKLWNEYQRIEQNLSETKYALPLPVASADKITQHHLNVWHRWFTDNTKKSGWNFDNKNLISTHDLQNQFILLHDLNLLVHDFHLQEWPKPQIANHGNSMVLRLLPVKTIRDINGDAPHIWFSEEQRKYHSFEPADLILDAAIHGKSTLQSFIDNDNPNHWDTTGHHMTYGGCNIITSNWRQKIYASSEFDEWAKKNNTNISQLKGDYPLGMIRNKDKPFLNQLAQGHNLLNNTTVDCVVHTG